MEGRGDDNHHNPRYAAARDAIARWCVMPAGRPTEYRPEYGEEMVSLMATGLSLTAAAAELGFHRATIYGWAEQYPEFGDTINVARGKRVLHLERRLLNDDTPSPAITGTIFALKNADAEEWREKVTQENVGPDGGPQKHEVIHRLSEEAADALKELTNALR